MLCPYEQSRTRSQGRYASARAIALRKLIACQRPPRGVATPRAFSASAIARSVVTPDFWILVMIGRTLPAARSASALIAATASSRAASIWGLPSLKPFDFAAAGACLEKHQGAIRRLADPFQGNS
jgi:hypothetical protein